MSLVKKRIALGFGSKKDEVATPEILYDFLNGIHGFDFDPCPIERPEWNGLTVPWGKVNWVNPPFSETKKWIEKAVEEQKKGNKTIMLLPLRTNAVYWKKLVWPNLTSLPELIERPLRFKGYEHGFPTPLCLLEFDGAKERIKTIAVKLHSKGQRPKVSLRKFQYSK